MARTNGSLEDVLIDGLRDIYNAENQLIKALPKLVKAASSHDLRDAIEEHLDMTRMQVERLERVFDLLEESPRGKKCAGMEGLIAEAKELLEQDFEDEALDAAIIAAAQKVEHYEIAAYGSLATWAKQLGQRDVLQLLLETLGEEKETDEKLTALAKSHVNREAKKAGRAR